MCGIAGFIIKEPASSHFLELTLRKMSNEIIHRGPDDFGSYISESHTLGLAHRRLSIIDLSENGRQPMASFCKRYVICFNGEIYNFFELKKQLRNVKFSGNSDTEVLVNYISIFGLEKTLEDIKGQFAFGVFDIKEQQFYICRDFIGEKPLYYSLDNESFVFGSELSVISHSGLKSLSVSDAAINLFLRFGYIPAPNSIFDEVKKILPGQYLRVSATNLSDFEIKTFFNIQDRYLKNINCDKLDSKELSTNFEALLHKSVESQLISDVPIGGLLSGGIDSSLICAIANEITEKPLNTFTIGFSESEYDESNYASLIAKELGTNHHELILSPNDIVSTIPRILSNFDEPFGDSSQIPTYMVMEHAASKVKVVLSGDGGDELFGGYTRYMHVPRVWSYLKYIPEYLRKTFLPILRFMPIEALNKLRVGDIVQIGTKLEKVLLKAGKVRNQEELYLSIIQEKLDGDLFGSNNASHEFIDNRNRWPSTENFILDMMVIDMLTYLPDDILTKVDRTSMMCSIESRAPFLDKEIIDFAISLPIEMKISGGTSKVLLREMLQKKIPTALYERPKMGFTMPISIWMKNDLSDWVKGIFDDSIYFDRDILKSSYDRFLEGRMSYTLLWNLISLESWLQEHKL